tara:strand:- start:2921 stop:4096 length:1176 start_codon:yes stop_codon:yes gene_type:complete
MENKITVKDLGQVEEKSKAQVEEELLKKHEEEEVQAQTSEAGVERVNLEQSNRSPESSSSSPEQESVPEESKTQEKTPSSELNEENVLSYIKQRYDKDISSVEELWAQQESNEDLPEDVSAYFKYKKETGRGIEDYVRLQKNYTEMDDDAVLTDYYTATEDGLDAIDIQDVMEDKFGVDEDLDDPKDIKKRRLAKKRELSKAKKFFEKQKEQYKIPLESRGDGLSKEQEDAFKSYKSYVEESKTTEDARKKRYDWFLTKTNEVFNDEFKGFEFNIGEKSFTFKPGDAKELKSRQSDVNTFVNKYMDQETGMMKDAQGYHRAIAMAMNPEKFAKFFYDQGVATTVDDVARKSKNITMDRQTPQTFSKDGLKIRSVGDSSSGRGLKIRSIKKS